MDSSWVCATSSSVGWLEWTQSQVSLWWRSRSHCKDIIPSQYADRHFIILTAQFSYLFRELIFFRNRFLDALSRLISARLTGTSTRPSTSTLVSRCDLYTTCDLYTRYKMRPIYRVQDITYTQNTRWMTPALCYITLKLLATTTYSHISRAKQRTGLIVNRVLLGPCDFFLRGMTRVNSEPGLTLKKI